MNRFVFRKVILTTANKPFILSEDKKDMFSLCYCLPSLILTTLICEHLLGRLRLKVAKWRTLQYSGVPIKRRDQNDHKIIKINCALWEENR